MATPKLRLHIENARKKNPIFHTLPEHWQAACRRHKALARHIGRVSFGWDGDILESVLPQTELVIGVPARRDHLAQRAPKLRWLQTFNAGVDHPIFAEMLQRGIRLTTAAGTTAVPIALEGGSIRASGEGVAVDGSVATIGAAGTYRLSGILDDGQIVVNVSGDGLVRLVLDGATLSSSTSAPIAILDAEEVVIVLADGTQNVVSDAAAYVYAAPDVDVAVAFLRRSPVPLRVEGMREDAFPMQSSHS